MSVSDSNTKRSFCGSAKAALSSCLTAPTVSPRLSRPRTLSDQGKYQGRDCQARRLTRDLPGVRQVPDKCAKEHIVFAETPKLKPARMDIQGEQQLLQPGIAALRWVTARQDMGWCGRTWAAKSGTDDLDCSYEQPEIPTNQAF